jgi:hypothetical protein
MKKFIAILTVAFIAACPSPVIAQNNLENDPGYLPIDKAFDFAAIKPEVNINLPKFLLKDALADFDGGKNDPTAGKGVNIAELIKDIKLIRVVVMEGKKNKDKSKDNSEAIAKGMATIRATLEKSWTPVAVVAEEKEKVGIYAMGDPAGESTAGLAVLVHEDGGDAVIANIVGKVSLGKIAKAASQMGKFPKDLLKKLNSAADGGDKGDGEKSKEGSEKSENPAKEN